MRDISEFPIPLSLFQHPARWFLQELNSLAKFTCRTHDGNSLYHVRLLEAFVGTLFRKRVNLCDILWIPYAKDYSTFYRDEPTAITIIDNHSPFYIDTVLNYQRLNSLCIRPPDEASFLMMTANKLLHLKLISCSYDPKVFINNHHQFLCIINIDFIIYLTLILYFIFFLFLFHFRCFVCSLSVY